MTLEQTLWDAADKLRVYECFLAQVAGENLGKEAVASVCAYKTEGSLRNV
jgi:hypothetical protein